MKKVSIIGHFGFGKNLLNGQTIKTKIVADELERIYGKEQVNRYDTHGGWKFFLKMPFVLLKALASGKSVIMLPAYKGVRIMTPLLYIFNKLFHRQLLYITIGGWLPTMLKSEKMFRNILKTWDCILVETHTMLEDLQLMGFQNVIVMPNCKRLNIVDTSTYKEPEMPLRLCTFSRVMKEKGIEDAVEAVNLCNKAMGQTAYTLDIYGQVEHGQKEWFEHLVSQFPQYIKYRGSISYEKSTYVLKDYFALLFPTFYQGEGLAGTIIDAFAAGLPVITTNWHDNTHIVKENHTGFIIPIHSPREICKILENLAEYPSSIQSMRTECTVEAQKYQPEVVIQTVVKLIDDYQLSSR
ncbi:MAG: glycosyltransferase [Prevotella sp.]|jgi:glycosyltransferase involved in cell wall biosynthesis